MIKIRKGNDFVIVWQVIINKGDVTLEELENVDFELTDQFGNLCPIEAEIHGEYAYIRFLGVDQKRTGEYKLTLWVNKGRRGQAVVDRCHVFALTPCTDKAEQGEQTGLTICPDLSIESVNLAIGIKGDKGDPGETPDLSGVYSRLSAQERINESQQIQIDKNRENSEQIQQAISIEDENENGIPDGEDRLRKIESDIADVQPMTDEDYQKIREIIK